MERSVLSYVDQIRGVAEIAGAFGKRPVRTNWGRDRQREFDYLLALLYADLHEGLMTGLTGRLVYVSAHSDPLPSRFLGLPVGIEIYAIDTSQFRTVNGIVAEVRIGASDGELTCYEFTVVDATTLLRGKFNSRIFKGQRLPDLFHTLFAGYSRTPAFSRAVDLDLSMLDTARYPERAFVRQADEPDGKFIERLARRDGITYFARAGDRSGKSDRDSPAPMHTIAMFDDPLRLPRTRAGTLRYRRMTVIDVSDCHGELERARERALAMSPEERAKEQEQRLRAPIRSVEPIPEPAWYEDWIGRAARAGQEVDAAVAPVWDTLHDGINYVSGEARAWLQSYAPWVMSAGRWVTDTAS